VEHAVEIERFGLRRESDQHGQSQGFQMWIHDFSRFARQDDSAFPVCSLHWLRVNACRRASASGGDGAKRRQVSVPAADLAKLACAVVTAKERFGEWCLSP
jgi:hypothetical protein